MTSNPRRERAVAMHERAMERLSHYDSRGAAAAMRAALEADSSYFPAVVDLYWLVSATANAPHALA
ncbi:MAG: hypothetical protein ACT4R6_03785, partial [Gemmatimonadaceae bacterium]